MLVVGFLKRHDLGEQLTAMQRVIDEKQTLSRRTLIGCRERKGTRT